MIKKLLPIILLIIGTGAGVGAGIMLKPAPEEHVEGEEGATDEAHGEKVAKPKASKKEDGEKEEPTVEYVKLPNQFVVPVVHGEKITSLVVLTLNLEVEAGTAEGVRAREPKLRDLFLRVLFDHANMGGFRGSFTKSENMDLLREGLREVAQKEMGETIQDVLILDIVRQDSK